MKQLIKVLITLCMAAVMAFAVIPAVSAEEVEPEGATAVTIYADDDGTKAYDLVWKYKIEDGHLYRRRWNKTLNIWYDPAWILVY